MVSRLAVGTPSVLSQCKKLVVGNVSSSSRNVFGLTMTDGLVSSAGPVQQHKIQHQCQRQQKCGFATWPKVRPMRVRAITMDVTGTIVSFRGTLEQHYLGAAEKCGITGIDASRINDAFSKAYKETSRLYPCFGGDKITAKQWWKNCVVRSFRLAGVETDEHTEDLIFQRIYSTFGSNAAYEIFDDASPFLSWAQRNGLVCGVLSNADERYGDSILPMLGLTHDELQFQCFSKDFNMEKPNAKFFTAAMSRAEPFLHDKLTPIHPSQVLHIGNDFQKDFEGARYAGMHAVLLNRYGETELAQEWRRRGAIVFNDLIDVVHFLGESDCQLG